MLTPINARQAPWIAVLLAAGCAATLTYFVNAEQLIVMLVFGATSSYLMILAAHWHLRHIAPAEPRPYRSPGGNILPVLGLLLGALTFIACFLADVKWSSIGVALMLSFALYLRLTEPAKK